MNITKLVGKFHDKAIEAAAYGQGQAAAYREASESIRKMYDCDQIEMHSILTSVPEPSDAERMEWRQATREYVETMESVLKDVIRS